MNFLLGQIQIASAKILKHFEEAFFRQKKEIFPKEAVGLKRKEYPKEYSFAFCIDPQLTLLLGLLELPLLPLELQSFR